MRLPFYINGTDFSELANKYEYSLSYTARNGSNGGVMLDGSKVVDILAWKAVITWDLNDMNAANLSAIQNACLADYVEVTYWDTKANAERTAMFIPSLSGADIGILRASGLWWKNISLKLEEK